VCHDQKYGVDWALAEENGEEGKEKIFFTHVIPSKKKTKQ